MFTPAMNGKNGRKPVKVKRCHYSKEYRTLEDNSSYDFAVLELEEALEKNYGYLGIDYGGENLDGVEEM